MRLGYYELNRPKERSDDWIWLIDHSVQIGVEKCLVILGIRQSQLPERGKCLQHQDMELIELLPVKNSNQEIVEQQLENAVAKTGVPRAILEDHGSDLKGGVTRFCEKYEGTCQVYDIKHKTACTLKKQLEQDQAWNSFSTEVGQTKFKVQQTNVAFLVPPSQRSKARYMNLGKLIKWGTETLDILEQKPSHVLQNCSADELEEKLGWLRKYRTQLAEWQQLQAVIDTTNHFVRSQGLYRGAGNDLAELLQPLATCARGRVVMDEFVCFVTMESQQVKDGERLPGSTEVLESCFGKLKMLEGNQSKNGFTGLILGLGAIVATTSTEVIQNAMQFARTADVLKWCKDKLGATVQSQRKNAYHPPEKKQNSDEIQLALQ